MAGAALCEPSCADFVAGAVLCEPPCADLVAGTALCCLPRGRMYALASAGHRRWMCRFRGRRSLRVQISWQAQDFAACQGVGCTPWRRLGTGAGCADFVAGAALCEPSCADLVAGTALCEPPCADLVAGTALCCLPRGRMYALASAGHRRWMCVFSWQAQHFVNLHVQISWQAQYFVNLRVQISWQAQALCCLPRGRMYALASAGHRRWMCRFRGRRSTL